MTNEIKDDDLQEDQGIPGEVAELDEEDDVEDNNEDESEEDEEEVSEEPEEASEEELKSSQPEKSEEDIREKRKSALQKRINKLNRERYQALALAKKREEENAELKRMLDISGQTAQYHFDKTIEMNLEKAKKAKEEAKISGNIDAEVDADIMLSKAIQDYNNAEQWKQQQNLYQQYAPSPHQAQPDIVDQIPSGHLDHYGEWKSSNEWFEAPTDGFEEKLSNEISNYSYQLNNYLNQIGRPDMIMSREYFQELDAKAQQLKDAYQPNNTERPPARGSVHMGNKIQRPQQRPVTSVGTSRNTVGSSKGNGSILLSAEQKQQANAIGMKEKDYARYVLNFQRRQRAMREQGE